MAPSSLVEPETSHWEFFQEICFLGTLACPAIVKEGITHVEFLSLFSPEKPISTMNLY